VDGLSTGGQMPRVDAKNMSFEKALRIFRKKCDNAGIKEECRERKYHVKPNQKRNETNNYRKRTKQLELKKKYQLELKIRHKARK
jgi:ribosomal protein S21